tara:strand:- start:12727 stop:15405 length:2679 start_codon:yes stop_codon:yes gene_type:complete
MKTLILLVVLTSWSLTLSKAEVETVNPDILVVGATESGWAAAIQAARLGVDSILIVHDGEWFGGQYTEQALACVDENKGMDNVGWGVDWHPMKRAFHRSGLFKELMDRIEAQNTENYGSPMPGKPWHGPSTFRPAEAEAAFRALIQPYLDSGQIRVIWKRYPVSAEVLKTDTKHPKLRSVTFAPIDLQTAESGEPDLRVVAKLTIDASDWGDVVQVSGAAYECGPDPSSRYGEASAPTEYPENEMNPITWAMIVAESEGETPISKPERFDDRNYPRATPFSREAFGELKWDIAKPGVGSIAAWPAANQASSRQLSVYSVRRIVDGYSSRDGKTSILLNYMNGQDYPLERLPQTVGDALEATEPGASRKNIVAMTRKQRQIIFNDAKRHSLGVLHHLQNFVHERAPDKVNSFRNFHLSREFGTPDDLPPKPYIRESLRLKAMYMMREQDGRNRDSKTKKGAKPRFSEVMYPDGLFAWQFHYDFHRTGRTYLAAEGATGPWIDYHKPNRHTKFISDRCVFPLRSLIPESMDGLIGAQGNVGFSSIVSAAIRLHDQRIHIGQAAGATAAVALREVVEPRSIPYHREHLERVRDALCGGGNDGVPVGLWPFRDLPADHPNSVAIHRLAALGLVGTESLEVDFQADVAADEVWVRSLVDRFSELFPSIQVRLEVPHGAARGDVCQKMWEFVKTLQLPAFPRRDSEDADGDGIPDREDALLFTPNQPIVFAIQEPPLTPESDGIAEVVNDARFFDFGGVETSKPGSPIQEHGAVFDESRGFGWKRDLRKNRRVRNAIDGPSDSFLFTRGRDTWELAIANGTYQVTLCIGDSGHEQLHQAAAIEGVELWSGETTQSGQFAEKTVEVQVSDGRLTLEIGSGKANSNTCVNWLQIAEKTGQ